MLREQHGSAAESTIEHLQELVSSEAVQKNDVRVRSCTATSDSQFEEMRVGAEAAAGDLLLFLTPASSITASVVDSLAATASAKKSDLTLGNVCIKWPESMGGRTDWYCRNDDFSLALDLPSYCSKASEFWAWYLIGSRLISARLWGKAAQTYEEYRHDLGANNVYIPWMDELVLVSALFADAVRPTYCDNDGIIYDWGTENEMYTDVAGEASVLVPRLQSSQRMLESVVKHNGVPKESSDELFLAFVCRTWWRLSWALSAVQANSLGRAIQRQFDFATLDRSAGAELAEADLEAASLPFADQFASLLDQPFSLDPANATVDGANTWVQQVSPEPCISIYVAMHNPSWVPKGLKYLRPIQVGTALATTRFPDTLHDDDCEASYTDDISAKNRSYCEATAHYWAWRHDHDSEYIGMWHYRRYLAFDPDVKEDTWGNIVRPTLDDQTVSELGISDHSIAVAAESYPVIVSTNWPIHEDGVRMTVLEHWNKHFNPDDMDLATEIITEAAPEYLDSWTATLSASSIPFCNLFIMRRDHFEEYSRFLFSVLSEFEHRWDPRLYSTEQYRVIGHLAERLLACYVRSIESGLHRVPVLHLSKTLFRDTSPEPEALQPLCQDTAREVTVALACDDSYMPYTSVLIQSMVDNSTEAYFYDIIILHQNITPSSQRLAQSIVAGHSNVALRFVNVSRKFADHRDLHVDKHISIETYFRFLIPELFATFERVLYLDCDMVADADIADLFFSDITGFALGATRDLDFIASAIKDPNFYYSQILDSAGMDDFTQYFQAGAILFNLAEFRDLMNPDLMFALASSRSWFFHDQDVLNSLFAGRVSFIGNEWDVLSKLTKWSDRRNLYKDYLPAKLAEIADAAAANPKIVHFAGYPKPWDNAGVDLEEYFWKYARRTPAYEQLLTNLAYAKTTETAWVIFDPVKPCPADTWIPFLRLETLRSVWTTTYMVVDFARLDDQQAMKLDTAYISVGRYPHAELGSWCDIKELKWQYGVSGISDAVRVSVEPGGSVRFSVAFTGRYSGFSATVRTLTSRSQEKPSVLPLTQGIWTG